MLKNLHIFVCIYILVLSFFCVNDFSTIAMVKHAETAWGLKFEGSWDSQSELREFILKHMDRFMEAMDIDTQALLISYCSLNY